MIAMNEVGIPFRATKDLDIVLHIEAINREYVATFKEFVKLGGYQNRQKSTGKDIFYRYSAPTNNDFPAMLELFSRKPEKLKLDLDGDLTPIALDDEIISLSAILLDDSYYNFIRSGKREVGGLPIIDPPYLIPLKAKAWLELTNRKMANEQVDERDIKKHKNDILRLHQLLSISKLITLPFGIKVDLSEFLDRVENEPIDLKTLNLKSPSFQKVINDLKTIYNILPL